MTLPDPINPWVLPAGPADRAALPPHLAGRHELVRHRQAVAGRVWDLLKPRCCVELISEEDFQRDERLPYWADLWPSALVLAERVAGTAGGGRPLLELGAGLGLASLAAAAAGWNVLATDYYQDALDLIPVNARRMGVPPPATRLLDWRDWPGDLGRFDLAIGSDVLYERAYAELLASGLARCLAEGGTAWITDPTRSAAAGFPACCGRHGLRAETLACGPASNGSIEQTIVLYEVRRG